MKIERRLYQTTLAIVGVAVIALFVAQGCKKEPPAARSNHAGHDHASVDAPAAEAVATPQTTCPIMEGNPINEAIFVEYEGKKVYFCCKACPETFLADPEKYIAKLPQFQQ